MKTNAQNLELFQKMMGQLSRRCQACCNSSWVFQSANEVLELHRYGVPLPALRSVMEIRLGRGMARTAHSWVKRIAIDEQEVMNSFLCLTEEIDDPRLMSVHSKLARAFDNGSSIIL